MQGAQKYPSEAFLLNLTVGCPWTLFTIENSLFVLFCFSVHHNGLNISLCLQRNEVTRTCHFSQTIIFTTKQNKPYWQHTGIYFEENCKKKKIPCRTQLSFNFVSSILREVRISQFAWCYITPTNHKYYKLLSCSEEMIFA